MQRFQPVINKFKNAFFGGDDSDAEVLEKAKPKARGAGRGAARGSSPNSQLSGSNGRGRGRGRGASKTRPPAAAPINEACLGDSDDSDANRKAKRGDANNRRRKIGEEAKNLPSQEPNSQRSLRSRSRHNEQEQQKTTPTQNEIEAMTVPQLKEICVLNNLGIEKALKK